MANKYYLTYKGKGTYSVNGRSFLSGKTLEVDEKTYKRLISPLFAGKVQKIKVQKPEAVKVEKDEVKEGKKGAKDKKG